MWIYKELFCIRVVRFGRSGPPLETWSTCRVRFARGRLPLDAFGSASTTVRFDRSWNVDGWCESKTVPATFSKGVPIPVLGIWSICPEMAA